MSGNAILGSCAGCRFSRTTSPTDVVAIFWGRCHRYAPGRGACTYFPIVQADDWCGEFEPKESA